MSFWRVSVWPCVCVCVCVCVFSRLWCRALQHALVRWRATDAVRLDIWLSYGVGHRHDSRQGRILARGAARRRRDPARGQVAEQAPARLVSATVVCPRVFVFVWPARALLQRRAHRQSSARVCRSQLAAAAQRGQARRLPSLCALQPPQCTEPSALQQCPVAPRAATRAAAQRKTRRLGPSCASLIGGRRPVGSGATASGARRGSAGCRL